MLSQGEKVRKGFVKSQKFGQRNRRINETREKSSVPPKKTIAASREGSVTEGVQ